MILSLKIIILLIVILLGFCLFYALQIKRKSKFCYVTSDLHNSFQSRREKYTYLRLNKSSSYDKILLLSINKNKKIFCQKYLYSKIANLIVISKFIDYKINTNSQKFRAKNNLVLIEQIASVVAYSVFTDKKCSLFSVYKQLSLNYKLRQKEHKVFKFLLGRFLIDNLFDIESEIMDISRVIEISKTTNKIKKYKKQLYFSAEVYSIKKYNPNSSKLLSNENFDYLSLMKNLFNELSDALEKEKIIISYLLVMFS